MQEISNASPSTAISCNCKTFNELSWFQRVTRRFLYYSVPDICNLCNIVDQHEIQMWKGDSMKYVLYESEFSNKNRDASFYWRTRKVIEQENNARRVLLFVAERCCSWRVLCLLFSCQIMSLSSRLLRWIGWMWCFAVAEIAIFEEILKQIY